MPEGQTTDGTPVEGPTPRQLVEDAYNSAIGDRQERAIEGQAAAIRALAAAAMRGDKRVVFNLDSKVAAHVAEILGELQTPSGEGQAED